MSFVTLTSLAMLKVNIDQGKDYLDYLKPFVLHVLSKNQPEVITDEKIRQYVLDEFGLEIPERVVQIVLRRIARDPKYPLQKEKGVYRIAGNLPDSNLERRRAEAKRHIDFVISGLIEFSRKTINPLKSEEEAFQAILSFLSEFDVPCLRSFLRGTALPEVSDQKEQEIVLVSSYVLHIQRHDIPRFQSFIILVQGHMLANALLAPDLHNAPQTYKHITFYLDTPLLVHLLGLEGDYREKAAKDLLKLLRRLGGRVAIFAHTRQELEQVIEGAAYHIDDPNGRGSIVKEARRKGRTKSDLLLMKGKIDEKLSEFRIEIHPTPPYDEKYQISEESFEGILLDEISYHNPRAKDYDINSLRSIYVLRKGNAPTILEKAGAVLVTSNAGFARAAWKYGQQYEESREVSLVITDFVLANVSWLKVPLGAPDLPQDEVLAYSYAALQPSDRFLDKLIAEIDKLHGEGKITARDHQLLRSSVLAQDELMHFTLGDEEALTEASITEVLQRVKAEIKREEREKLSNLQKNLQEAKTQIEHLRQQNLAIQSRVREQCESKAKRISWSLFLLIGFLLLLPSIGEGKDFPSNLIPHQVYQWLFFLYFLVSFFGMLLGSSVIDLRKHLHKYFYRRCIRRESSRLGLELEPNPKVEKR